MRGILYYDTKYGSTLKVSKWITSEITYVSVDIEAINEKTMINTNYDFYILGCPIYIGKPREEMHQFIMNNKVNLQNKIFFLFIISWAQSTVFQKECTKFMNIMEHDLHPAKAILSISLSGKLILDELIYKDRCTILRILRRIDNLSDIFQSKEIRFMDQTNEKESKEFGKNINKWLQSSGNML